MFDEINLAVKKEVSSSRRDQIDRIKLVSFICLFAVALISISIFFVNLRYSTGSIKRQQTQAIQSLSPYSDTVAKVYILNSRLTDINAILAKRRDFTKDVGQIVNAAGSGVLIKNLQIDSQNQLVISVTSSSLSSINDFLNDTLKLSTKGTIGSVKLTGLKTIEDGFILSMGVTLK